MKSETKGNLVGSQKTAEEWYTIEQLAELSGISIETLKGGHSPLLSIGVDTNTRLGGYHNTQKFYSQKVLDALREYQCKNSTPNAVIKKDNYVDSHLWYTLQQLSELLGLGVDRLNQLLTSDELCNQLQSSDTRLGGYHNTQKFYSANVLKALKEYQIKTSVPNALKDKQTALEGNLSYIGNVAVNGVAGELDIMQCIENALVLVRGEVAKLKQQNSQLQEENGSLQIQFDENKKWRTIKWMESKTQQHFNWRELKKASLDLGYDVKKVFDQNYGEVNTYHIDAWERAYGDAVASVILDDVEE